MVRCKLDPPNLQSGGGEDFTDLVGQGFRGKAGVHTWTGGLIIHTTDGDHRPSKVSIFHCNSRRV